MIRTLMLADASPSSLAVLLEQAVMGAGCRTILDIGCGLSNLPRGWRGRLDRLVGVATQAETIDASMQAGVHHEYRQLPLELIASAYHAGDFDAVLAIDLVERLDKLDGLRLLERLDRIARKRVVVITHNGPSRLRSGWSVPELRRRGYRVRGLNGWRTLHGRQPASLCRLLSRFSQPFCDRHPQHALQLFAVKNVEVGQAA